MLSIPCHCFLSTILSIITSKYVYTIYLYSSSHVLFAVFVRVFEVNGDRTPQKILKHSILDIKDELAFLGVNVNRKLEVHIVVVELMRQHAAIPLLQTPSNFILKFADLDSESPAHFEMRDFQAYNICLDNEDKFGCELASNSSLGFGCYSV